MKQWTDSPEPAPDTEPEAHLTAYLYRLKDDPDCWLTMVGECSLTEAEASCRSRFGRRLIEVKPLKVRR